MKFLQKNALLLGLAILKLIGHYIFQHPDFELHRDEYLYLEMGRHLAWGYFSVPPAIGLEGAIAYWLGGNEEVIRFFPYFFGALTLFFVGKITQKLGGGWFAQLLACCGMLVIPFTRINLLFQPNSLEVLCFTIIFYLLVLLIQTQKPSYFIWIGLFVGISVLNKYTTFVFIIALVIGLLLTPVRKLLVSKQFFFGICLAFLIVLPNIIWQFQHHIPALEHIHLLNKYQLVNVSLSHFFLMQLLLCFAALFLWTAGLLTLFIWKKFQPYRIIGIIFLLGIFIIGFSHGKDYYTLGYFPVLFSFGSLFFEEKLENGWIKWLRLPLFLFPFFITYLVLPVAYPAFSLKEEISFAPKIKKLGFLRWEDGKDHELSQDYADMLGWEEMADKVYAAYQKLSPEQQRNTSIITGNYGQFCAINYYNRHKNLPNAFCFNWDGIFWVSPEMLNFQNVIIVDDEPDNEFAPHFKTYQIFDEVKNPNAREKGTQIIIATGADSLVHQHVQEEYQKYRKLFF